MAKFTPNHYVFHDSEWYRDDRERWLSTTFHITTYKKDKKNLLPIFEEIETFTIASIEHTNYQKDNIILVSSFFEIKDILFEKLANHQIKELVMVNFFSPLDIFWIFPKQFPDAIQQEERTERQNLVLTQKGILHGAYKTLKFNIKFQDYSGILGHSSLKDKLITLGIEKAKKSQADKWKEKMNKFLTKYPEKFFDYAEYDVRVLPKIYFQTQFKLNKIAFDLKIRKIKAPLTLGSTVAKILHEHMVKSQKEIIKRADLNKILTKNSQKGFLKYHRGFKEFAFITGGRCNNEQPENYIIKNACDIDIKACYANIMKNLEIPIGEITTIKNDGMTIREILEKIRPYKFYWNIVFDAYFSFNQDLFPTKILTKSSEESDDEENFMSIMYFEREVKNGMLTENLLDMVFKYWSQEQIEEFLNIKFSKIIYHENSKIISTYQLKEPFDYFTAIREDKNNPLSAIGKICQNTIYGVLVSPYFIVGNIIVGNIITATARSQIYQLKKECNLVQSITDGGLCEYSDKLKNLDMPFDISFKMKEKKAVYINKADYAYENTIKTRGTRNQANIKQKFLQSLLENKSFHLDTRLCFDKKLKKINAYNLQKSAKLGSFISTRHLPAGAEFYQPKIFHLSALHTKFQDIETYKKYRLLEERKRRNHQGLYEQYLNTNHFSQIIPLMISKTLSLSEKLKIINSSVEEAVTTLEKIKEIIVINGKSNQASHGITKYYGRFTKILPQKTINITFKNKRTLQSEATIYEEINNTIFSLPDQTPIQQINIIFERYYFKKTLQKKIAKTQDDFVNYAVSTIEAIPFLKNFRYAIFFLETKSDNLFLYKNSSTHDTNS